MPTTTTNQVIQAVLGSMRHLVTEVHDLTHTTMSDMSPRSQLFMIYSTLVGSAVATTLLLTSTFGTMLEREEQQLTLADLVPKRINGSAEGGRANIASSPQSVTDFDQELPSFSSTNSSSSVTKRFVQTTNDGTITAISVQEEEEEEEEEVAENQQLQPEQDHAIAKNTTTTAAATTAAVDEEVVFEESGSLGTYYIVGESKPTPKQQLENLLDTMIKEPTMDTTPCPPSFRKKRYEEDEHHENMQSNEQDYRLLSNKAYYPTAMAAASNSVTKSWSSVMSGRRRNGERGSTPTATPTSTSIHTISNTTTSSASATQALGMSRFGAVNRSSRTPAGLVSKASRTVSHDMREFTAISRQPRVARSAGKHPPQRSGLNRFVTLPSPSMNRMRTRDQHLSYDGNPHHRATTNQNSSSLSPRTATKGGSISSDWTSTPSPSLPLGRSGSSMMSTGRSSVQSDSSSSSGSSLSSPSPAAPSPRSASRLPKRQQQRRSGSVLGPSRANGAARAPTATISLTSQKISKQQQQQQGSTASALPNRGSTNTEVRRIMFNMPNSPPKASGDAAMGVMETGTPPSKLSFNSPAKQSSPASALSPSPAQQARAVSRTLSYTPGKLPSTKNSIVV